MTSAPPGQGAAHPVRGLRAGRRVAGALVLLSAVGAIAYSVGPSHHVDTSTAEVGRTVWEGHAAAFGSAHALVVWPDMRELNDGARCNIWGTRLTPTGEVADPQGIAIGGPPGFHRSQPAVAYGGGQWLVAWNDRRAGTEDVYAARVSATGVVLDPAGLAVAATGAAERAPSVAYDGTHFLVVWELGQADGGTDLAAAGVRPDGTVEPTFWTNDASFDQRRPRAACSPSGQCLVAWEDLRASPSDLYTTTVQGTAVASITGAPISAPGAQGPLAVAYDAVNAQFVLAWRDTRSAAEEIWAGRVSTLGAVLSAGFVVGGGAGTRTAPTLTCHPASSQCLVGWQQTTGTAWDVMSARLDPAGDTVLDTPAVQHTTDPRYQADPAVAWLGTAGYLLAFFDNRWPGNDNTRAVRVDSATGQQREPPAVISTGYPRQLHPSIASDGVSVLAAWLERHDGVFFARLRPLLADGQPAGSPVALHPSGTLGYVGTYVTPSLAPSKGGEYLVAWSHADLATSRFDVLARRATALGLLDDAGTLLSTGTANATGPSVAWDGTRYVVVFDDVRSGSWDLWGMRVSQAGALLDPDGGRPLVVQPLSQLNPELACHSGGGCLMLWGDRRDAGYAVMAATLDPAAMALGATVELEPSADPEYFDVAAGTSGYLAVWSRVVDGGDLDVRGARITTSGSVIDVGGLPIVASGTFDYDPVVAFDGTDFQVVLSHEVAGFDQTVISRFTWAGQVDATPTVLAASPRSWQADGRLALGPGGQLLLAWTQYDDPARRTWQVSVRAVAPGDGGVTTVDAGIDAGAPDAGASDAGAADAGDPDAGGSDAGASDAGGSDAGASDAGGSDAGASDAGGSDAGGPDAGGSDAGASDAGASDAGGSDAGEVDAGGSDGGLGPRFYRVGCDCAGTGGLPVSIAVVLVVLVGARRRGGRGSHVMSGRRWPPERAG